MATLPDTAANPARELAAIMFSDVVGYTAIMGRDENEALRALDAHRELLRTLLPKFNGRMVGEIGDGTLSSFHSAIDAVNCAREVQASLQDRPQSKDQPELKVRIGIHLGDVVFSNNTVLGDGVNVARSETSREPASKTSASKDSRTFRAQSVSMRSPPRPIGTWPSDQISAGALLSARSLWRRPSRLSPHTFIADNFREQCGRALLRPRSAR